MGVECPPGNLIADVDQEWGFCTPKFKIKTATGDVILKIKGPFSCCLVGEVAFQVFNKNKEEVGKITKKWGGLAREAFTDADNFEVTFKKSMDLNMKAIILCVTFLIDFMYFENKGNNNRRHHHGRMGHY